MAILLITHDMGVVAGRADRVNVMYAGRIVETAHTSPLFKHMHHPYTQALLGSIPKLTQDPDIDCSRIPGIPPDLTAPPSGCRFAPRCRHATDKCLIEEPPLDARRRRSRLRLLASGRRPGGRRESAFAAARRGPPDEQGPVLVLDDLVREYPITSGMILQRGTAR